MKEQDFEPGDFVASTQHLKIGVVVGWERIKDRNMVRVRYRHGIVGRIAHEDARHASPEQIAEYDGGNTGLGGTEQQPGAVQGL